MRRAPSTPRVCTTASSAIRETHMSDGWAATQWSLVPKRACERLKPSIAGQPEPGARLLHGYARSRKYRQRVRCMTLPPTVAMLRSWADAPCGCAGHEGSGDDGRE